MNNGSVIRGRPAWVIVAGAIGSIASNKRPNSLLIWDGKDTDGRVVAGGIYLYQIEFQGKQATGTVVVAR